MEQNQRWLRWTGEIVVDEKGKCEGSWIGRNFAYKPVVVKSPQDLMGKVLCVKVVKAFSSYLSADIQ
jgi:tRNA A37 methylthiotransferase MiaB